jgi:ketosteroid isomerase-like protein
MPIGGRTGQAGGVTETSDSDVDIVLAAYAAYAGGDITAAVQNLHPDVVWIEPDEFPNGGRREGRAAVAEYLQASYDGWRELRSMPLARRDGSRVIVEHHVEGVLADGTDHQMTVADVFLLRGGQVVHMQAFADPADVPS